MSKGVIDGALFNYEAAESYGLAPATSFVQEPGLATSTLALVMNPASYERLPRDLQTLIDDTTRPVAAEKLGAMWDDAERTGRDYILAQKVQILPLSVDKLMALKEKLGKLDDESPSRLESAGKPAKAFLREYRV